MKIFVEGCQELYKENIMSYNLHGLLHVVVDVQKLGNLESYSAFRYENNMQEITKKIRKPGAVLEQYYNRFHEKNDLALVHEVENIAINPSVEHVDGPLMDTFNARRCFQFKKLQVGDIRFGTSQRDNCCILRNFEHMSNSQHCSIRRRHILHR